MVLLWKANHEERKCPFRKKKEQKNQLDINDYFSCRGKKHGSFWREVCQYWLTAPLEITVTVSISIWTLTPQTTQKLGVESKCSTRHWKASSPGWGTHSSSPAFTQTPCRHWGQAATPLRPAETIRGLFFILEAKCRFMDRNVRPGYSNSAAESKAGLISGRSIKIPEGNPKPGSVRRSAVEGKCPDTLRLEHGEWPGSEQEQLLPCDSMWNERPSRKSLSARGLFQRQQIR